MPRILYLNPTGVLGGAEHSLLGLLTNLDRRQYEPFVAAPSSGPFGGRVTSIGIPYVPLDMPEPLARLSLRGKRATLAQASLVLPAALRVASTLCARIRQSRPDLIHTNGIKAHVLGVVAGWLMRVPVVWHMRDFLPSGMWERLIVTLGRLGVTQIIANSEATQHALSDWGLGHKTVAIANGVNLETFRPMASSGILRRKVGIAPDVPLVGMIGMLAPWKGQDVFLRAAATLHAQHPAAHFLIVGGDIYRTAGHGDFGRRLREQVMQAGLHHCVTFTGYCDDMQQIFAELDVVVHASTRPEPFGRVVLEAMACGRAVVATDAGGVPEVLGTDSAAGLLVPPGDSEAMANAILTLLQSAQCRVRMGQAGRQRAQSLFDIRLHAERVQAVYRKLLESH